MDCAYCNDARRLIKACRLEVVGIDNETDAVLYYCDRCGQAWESLGAGYGSTIDEAKLTRMSMEDARAKYPDISLDEDEIRERVLLEHNICRQCNSRNTRFTGENEDERFYFYQCQDCGAVFKREYPPALRKCGKCTSRNTEWRDGGPRHAEYHCKDCGHSWRVRYKGIEP